MATVSVGTSGRTYSSVQAAWNALPSTLTEHYVFELYNDSEFTGVFDTSASAKTMGAYTVTIRPAAGHGFRDHANKLTNALRYNAANGVALGISNWGAPAVVLNRGGIILDGLQIKNTAGAGFALNTASGAGAITLQNCVIETDYGSNGVCEFIYGAPTFINCVVIQTNNTGAGLVCAAGGTFKGCTLVYIGSGTSSAEGLVAMYSEVTAIDCASFGFTEAFYPYSGGSFSASSDYNATDKASIGTGKGTHNVVSLTFANQFQAVGTSGSEDLRVKAGNGLVAGVTDASLTADIVGTTRAATPTIGAWEYAAVAGYTFPPPISSTRQRSAIAAAVSRFRRRFG